MKDNGSLIGVQEKREIAHLISDEYSRRITELQQQINFTEGEVLESAQKHFGLPFINQQIQQLMAKIKLLSEKKKELGFDSYDKFDTDFRFDNKLKETVHKVKETTKAGRFFYLKMKAHADVKALHQEQDARLKELWLTPRREEVRRISNREVKYKMIEYKKAHK